MHDNKQLILVADSDRQIILMLRDYLSAMGYAVLCAQDGQEALELFHTHNLQIDLLLLDIALPQVDGISVLSQVRQSSQVPAIFLSASQDEYDQIRSFRAGGDDYIQKPFSQSILVLRMEAILQRNSKTDVLPLTAGGISMDQLRRIATADGVRMDLTRREFDLLACLISNNSRVLTREQLRDTVWGQDFDGELRTVDTHVKQLRSKLGDYAPCLRTIFRVGYQFEAPTAPLAHA